MALDRANIITPQDEPDLAPLRASHEANEIEEALKALFVAQLEEFIRPGERAINTLGVPHLGEFDQVERASKNEGLAMYRRPDEAGMRYLFRGWRARNPKRGLHMLRFYLQIQWPNGSTLRQMYQNKSAEYPNDLITSQRPNRFRTSRVLVAITPSDPTGDDVVVAVPALRSAVPARFVLEFALLTETGNDLALASSLYSGALYQEYALNFT